MTIEANDVISGPFVGNGEATRFPRDFSIGDASHVEVTLDGVLQSSGYTVLDPEQTSGDIEFNIAPATGVEIYFTRNTPVLQDTDYSSQGAVSPEQIESDLDYRTRVEQEYQRDLNRTLKVAIGSSGFNVEAGSSGTVPQFNEDGDLVEGPSSNQISAAEGYSQTSSDKANEASNSANYAAEWANKNIDSLISTAAGGDGVDDYSAKHWAAKAAENAVNGFEIVSTRAEAKAINPLETSYVYLTENGREGMFLVKDGDFSSLVTLDTQEGIYLAINGVATTSQALVREYEGRANLKWFGAAVDGSTDDTTAINAALSMGVPIFVDGFSVWLGGNISDVPINIEGLAKGKTGFILNGNFNWKDNSTRLDGGLDVALRKLTFKTTGQASNLKFEWMPRPYFFNDHGIFHDLEFIIDDIEADQRWDNMLYCINGQGLDFRNISGNNERDDEENTGIRLQTCLVSRLDNIDINYVNDSVVATATPCLIVNFSGQTTNFTDGDMITAPSGATGRLMRTVGDAGSTGDIIVIQTSTINFAVSDVISDESGGSATIVAIDSSRTWAGEKLAIRGLEGVGVKRGVNVAMTNNVYQKFVGVVLNDIHANAEVYAVNIEYANQVFLGGDSNLYALAANFIGVRLVGVENGNFAAQIQDPINATGTVGIVVSAGVAGFGTNISDNIKYDIDFINIDTEESLDPAATNLSRALYLDPKTGEHRFNVQLRQYSDATRPAPTAGLMIYNTSDGNINIGNGAEWVTYSATPT